MTLSIPTTELAARITAHIAERVSCDVLGAEDGRIGCVTPLQYPDADHVVVWVRPLIDSRFEVTDYGEALAHSTPGKGDKRRALEDFARAAAAGQGVAFKDGRLVVESGGDDLVECVWGLAVAAAQVSQAAAAPRPRRQREVEFVAAVERDLRTISPHVEREHRLRGGSGHQHKATLYLPRSETVIEPVTGHLNQVYAAYAKLGDLGQGNGYRLYSLLDDRDDSPAEDVAGMLVQVSKVIQWSHRDEWITSVMTGA